MHKETPKLKPHQEKAVLDPRTKLALWMRPRCGKTPTAIRRACSLVKTCLVIVPLHIKEQWEEEIKRWNDTGCKFILYTKERFRIDSIERIEKKGRRQTLIFSDNIPRCDMVLVDEVHRQASNHTNKFFKCLHNYLIVNDVEHVLLLSGTPWNKNPWSVYSYGILLGYALDFWQWQTKYFIRIQNGMRHFFKPKENMFPELVVMLQSMGITVRLEDIAEIKDDYEEVEYFDLNAEQKKHIKKVVDTTPVARYSKYHQLESGTLTTDGYCEPLSFECEKDKRLLELVEDEDKIIIVCRYLRQLSKYEKLLGHLNKPIFVIKGKMDEDLLVVARKANAAPQAIVLVQADKSDGYPLDGFSTMVFASMSYSFISYDQMKERMKAMDKNKGCTYVHLLTRGKSVDKGIYESAQKGVDFNEELYVI